ncbi:acyloxyacyl hydrolase [Flavobacteriaceae bacterium]|nr:acyloxyacyl hydrolase [Flavobacteriaceae bacterium]MDB9911596.1 acyloxyacyl hydrolase [Flavobacteriaceae bacterium]
MQKTTFLLFLVFSLFLQAQEDVSGEGNTIVITPEILLGKTLPSNFGFPETKLYKQLLVNVSKNHNNTPREWAQRLKGLDTGISLSLTDFGQLDSLGIAFSLIPTIEFNAFKSKRLKILTGLGASYFTKKYDPITNPNNRAVSTDITWAFRCMLKYKLLASKNIDWNLGIGLSHHSNGHTKLDNRGYNAIVGSISGAITNPFNKSSHLVSKPSTPQYQKSRYTYLEVRAGHGWNVLAEAFNTTKAVYTISGEYGYVFNNVFKLGLGAHYRFYQHYYDYINNNESLVQDSREFEYLKQNPFKNATSLSLYLNTEILLDHFGLDFSVGYNLYKEAYQIDWRINEGWVNTPREIPEGWVLGEFNTKYNLKKSINTRLGIKYYLISTHKKPKHNAYTAVHLNSNLGQADFTEITVGYTYSFSKQ